MTVHKFLHPFGEPLVLSDRPSALAAYGVNLFDQRIPERMEQFLTDPAGILGPLLRFIEHHLHQHLQAREIFSRREHRTGCVRKQMVVRQSAPLDSADTAAEQRQLLSGICLIVQDTGVVHQQVALLHRIDLTIDLADSGLVQNQNNFRDVLMRMQPPRRKIRLSFQFADIDQLRTILLRCVRNSIHKKLHFIPPLLLIKLYHGAFVLKTTFFFPKNSFEQFCPVLLFVLFCPIFHSVDFRQIHRKIFHLFRAENDSLCGQSFDFSEKLFSSVISQCYSCLSIVQHFLTAIMFNIGYI